MKKLKLLFTLVLLALLTTNCEKDDLCAEDVTTPMIVLEFYSNSDRTTLKPVTNLKVTGLGLADSLANFNNVSKIMLPLKTTEDATEYSLVLFSTSEALKNENLLRFNYTRNNVYVSRACGYKTLFQLDRTTPFVLTDIAPLDNLWIRGISVEQPNIENQNETHINIYY